MDTLSPDTEARVVKLHQNRNQVYVVGITHKRNPDIYIEVHVRFDVDSEDKRLDYGEVVAIYANLTSHEGVTRVTLPDVIQCYFLELALHGIEAEGEPT